VAILATIPHHSRLSTTEASRPTKSFPFQFLFGSSPDPSAAARRKLKGKEMVLSVGFASVTPKQQTKTSFIAYAIPFVVSPFLRELWRYVRGNLRVRSHTRNAFDWHSLSLVASSAPSWLTRRLRLKFCSNCT